MIADNLAMLGTLLANGSFAGSSSIVCASVEVRCCQKTCLYVPLCKCKVAVKSKLFGSTSLPMRVVTK